MTGPDSGFLSRWSRRKIAAHDPAADAVEGPVVADIPEPDSALHPGDAEVVVDEAYISALAPVESITADTDLLPFLRKGVPQALRNAAMRRMWLADPLIRDHLDVARDYFWDWNAPGGVPGGGGSLSVDAVAQMMRDVIDGPGPVQDTAPVALSEAGTAAPTPAPPAELAPEIPEPAAIASAQETAQTPDVAVAGPSGPAHDQAPASVTLRPRRHGGAVPS
ncbi:MAG: DUF3306 domain-containing protein [Gemmobacter sp.]|nr:DUF3306 domain-containing protein [Gemmobacter sp.]